MTLDETISAGQTDHIADHQQIAVAINKLATVSAVTASNSTSVVDLASYTIPAGRLKADGDSIRLTVWGDITNSTGGSVNYTVFGVYGATTILTSNANGIATSASPRQWKAILELVRTGASSQSMNCAFTVSNASATNLPATNSGLVLLGNATGAENTANALALKFQVQMGTASASANCVARFSRYEYLPV